MQAFKFHYQLSNCQTVNFLTNEILWTFLSSQSKSEKGYWQCSRHFEEISLIFVYGKFTVSFPLIYCWHLTIFGSCYCKKQQIDVSFLCVCPLIDDKFHHNIVKVHCGTTRLRLLVPQPLWQCYDAIYHQKEDRCLKNWRLFVNWKPQYNIINNNTILQTIRLFALGFY